MNVVKKIIVYLVLCSAISSFSFICESNNTKEYANAESNNLETLTNSLIQKGEVKTVIYSREV